MALEILLWNVYGFMYKNFTWQNKLLIEFENYLVDTLFWFDVTLVARARSLVF